MHYRFKAFRNRRMLGYVMLDKVTRKVRITDIKRNAYTVTDHTLANNIYDQLVRHNPDVIFKIESW